MEIDIYIFDQMAWQLAVAHRCLASNFLTHMSLRSLRIKPYNIELPDHTSHYIQF